MPVVLVLKSTGAVVQAGLTDADGYYTLPYKHTGKPAVYAVYLLGGYNLRIDIVLNGKRFAEVSFDPATGTVTIEQGSGASSDSGGSTGGGKGKKGG